MSLWSRFFHSEDPPRKRLRDLELRLDDLEMALEHQQLQLKKLRGRVTGGVRSPDAPETQQEPAGATISPEADQHAQEIENGRLLAALRGRNGLLSR